MNKNLSQKQIEKGNRYLKNSYERLHNQYKNLIWYKSTNENLYCLCDTVRNEIENMKNEIKENKIYISHLERKYI